MNFTWPELGIPEDCHPKIRSLAEYWLRICPENGIPGRQHFDPLDIWDLVSNVWIVDVFGAPPRFRYRVIGTRIVEYLGSDPTGETMDEVFPHFSETFTGKHLLEVVTEGRPRWRRGTPTLRYEKDFKLVEQVSLPLAGDGKTTDMVLSLTEFWSSTEARNNGS